MNHRDTIATVAFAAFLVWSATTMAVRDTGSSRQDRSTAASSGTAITGHVRFVGEAPPPRKLTVNKDEAICGHTDRFFYEVRTNAEGMLRDVVVYLDSREISTADWKAPAGGYVLNQKGCVFDPYISVFPKDPNARLRIVNDDPTLHNIHAYEVLGRAKRGLFNISQPQGTAPVERPLTVSKRSNVIELKCDAHDFMIGWVFMADNPYCMLVGEDGKYSLSDLPPGEHTIKAWHPFLGTVRQTVEVKEGQELTLDLEFKKEKK